MTAPDLPICRECDSPILIPEKGLHVTESVWFCEYCARANARDMTLLQFRQSELDRQVSSMLDGMFEQSQAFELPQLMYQEKYPEWSEFRDSMMRCLFELDRVHHAAELFTEDQVL